MFFESGDELPAYLPVALAISDANEEGMPTREDMLVRRERAMSVVWAIVIVTLSICAGLAFWGALQ